MNDFTTNTKQREKIILRLLYDTMRYRDKIVNVAWFELESKGFNVNWSIRLHFRFPTIIFIYRHIDYILHMEKFICRENWNWAYAHDPDSVFYSISQYLL